MWPFSRTLNGTVLDLGKLSVTLKCEDGKIRFLNFWLDEAPDFGKITAIGQKVSLHFTSNLGRFKFLWMLNDNEKKD